MQEFTIIEKKNFWDGWTFGHVLFGCMTSAFFLIILDQFPRSSFIGAWLVFFSIFIATSIFTSWELLEHLVIQKEIYIKKLGLKNWRESLWNSLFDIIIATCFFSLLLKTPLNPLKFLP